MISGQYAMVGSDCGTKPIEPSTICSKGSNSTDFCRFFGLTYVINCSAIFFSDESHLLIAVGLGCAIRNEVVDLLQLANTTVWLCL